MYTMDEVINLVQHMSADEFRSMMEEVNKGLTGYIYIPNPGPQTAAFRSEADELFYGGAAGGGKTSLICGLAIQSHSRSLILRRTYPQLGGIFDEVERILGNREGLREQKKIWHLSPHDRIDFGSIQHEKDRENYQGRPHDLICFDEITQFTQSMYSYVIRWNRAANPDQRCRVVVTGNPPMMAAGRWVIDYWAPWLSPDHPNPAKQGELRWFTYNDNGEEIECDGPDHIPEGCTDRPKSRTFIAAKLEDNPDYMAGGYGATLAAQPEPYRSMLRYGDFNTKIVDQERQVIPSAWVILAQQRWQGNLSKSAPLSSVGIDVAQGGQDKTVFALRRGHYYEKLKVYKGIETPDGPSVVNKLVKFNRASAVCVVDLGGGYGGDVVTQLSTAGVDVKGFNGAASAPYGAVTQDGMRDFYNMRAFGYWKFRDALNPEFGSPIALPPDPELFRELIAPTYEITPRGIKIEHKEDIRARLGVSPDRADAVVMAYLSAEGSLPTGRDRAAGRKHPGEQQSNYQGAFERKHEREHPFNDGLPEFKS